MSSLFKLCLLFLFRQNDHKIPALHFGRLVNGCDILQFLTERQNGVHAGLLMCHLTPAETKFHLNLIPFRNELASLTCFRVQVIVGDAGSKLNLLDFGGFLRFSLALRTCS